MGPYVADWMDCSISDGTHRTPLGRVGRVATHACHAAEMVSPATRPSPPDPGPRGQPMAWSHCALTRNLTKAESGSPGVELHDVVRRTVPANGPIRCRPSRVDRWPRVAGLVSFRCPCRTRPGRCLGKDLEEGWMLRRRLYDVCVPA